MIYIHSLKDLSPKTAEVESIQIIRESKDKLKIPVSEDLLSKKFSEYFIDKNDILIMENSLRLIEPAINKIEECIFTKNPVYESINLNRSITMIEEVNEPLLNNISYIKEIESLQMQLLTELVFIFNNVQSAATEEKIRLNNSLNLIFGKILRNNEFIFDSNGIINEGKFTRMNDLCKSLNEGFLFHITVREHLDKVDFNAIKLRIPKDVLEKSDEVIKNVNEIKKGIDKAYECNMKMVKMAVVIYSYVRILIK